MTTQSEIAKTLGISQQAISQHMDRMDIDYESMTVLEVVVAMYKRAAATAGNVAYEDEEINGAKEKALKDRAERQLMQLKLAEAQGVLVNVASIEEKYGQRVDACKAEFMASAEKIKTMAFTVYGVDIDVAYLNEYIESALIHLAGSGDSGRESARPSVLQIPPAREVDDNGVGKEAPRNKRKSKRNTREI